MDRLEEIKARAESVPSGPWEWRGYTDGDIELRTRHGGGLRIVTTMRAEPCIVALADESISLAYGACGACRRYYAKGIAAGRRDKCEKPENLNTLWVWDERGFVSPINDFAVAEQTYRTDVGRVDHPIADFVAASREDIDWLVGEVERLRDDLHISDCEVCT